jgi:hypothetical protein
MCVCVCVCVCARGAFEVAEWCNGAITVERRRFKDEQKIAYAAARVVCGSRMRGCVKREKFEGRAKRAHQLRLYTTRLVVTETVIQKKTSGDGRPTGALQCDNSMISTGAKIEVWCASQRFFSHLRIHTETHNAVR